MPPQAEALNAREKDLAVREVRLAGQEEQLAQRAADLAAQRARTEEEAARAAQRLDDEHRTLLAQFKVGALPVVFDP